MGDNADKDKPLHGNDNPLDSVNGFMDGVSSILGKLGELAEKAEVFRNSQSEIDGRSKTGKSIAGSYGFSVKLAGGEQATSSSVKPFVKETVVPKRSSVEPVSREPHTDLFDEGDYLLIVAEMPGVSTEDVVVRFEDRGVHIDATTKIVKFSKFLVLEIPVEQSPPLVSANNGIVEIQLKVKV